MKNTTQQRGFEGSYSRCDYPLAMAYVPMQRFEHLYNAEQALIRGTIFKQLDLPFRAKRGNAQ